jgi:ATP-binding cassette, subfamily B, bacterial
MRLRLRCNRPSIRSKVRPMPDSHHSADQKAAVIDDRAEVPAQALSGLRFLITTAAATDKRQFWAGLILWVAASLVSPLSPLAFKALIDGVTAHDDGATIAAVILAVLNVSGFFAWGYSSMFMWNVWERMTVTIDEQLVKMSARLGLVDRTERPEYIDHLTLVRSNREQFQVSMMSLLSGVALVLQVLITVVILVAVAPVLLFLPVFSLAPVLASRWAEGRSQKALRDTASDTRAADSFMLLSIDPAAAGELRVLRLRDLVVERHRRAWNTVVDKLWRAEAAGMIVSTVALMVFTVGFGGALLFITLRSIEGDATLGSVILVLTAGQQLHNLLRGVLSSSSDLFRVLETVRHFSWLMRYVEQHGERGTLPVAHELKKGIELSGVTFRYASASEDAIHDLSLTLPAGSVVAVVGENGAGKSTLVKLLCGLMRPTSGNVLVDGRDLALLDADRWRGTMSGAFQDFVRFELLARESIGVGRVESIDDDHAVRDAMRLADVADLESDLPQSLETPLGRAFLDGIDLSGGQWQKIALARSMMRDGPLVLVLDEPTYSLDVESEQRVFEWFSRIAGSDNPRGTITVIVSHRFSTVRTADIVAVLQEGRLVEWGGHEELLAASGPYASMYRTQAEGYR